MIRPGCEQITAVLDVDGTWRSYPCQRRIGGGHATRATELTPKGARQALIQSLERIAASWEKP